MIGLSLELCTFVPKKHVYLLRCTNEHFIQKTCLTLQNEASHFSIVVGSADTCSELYDQDTNCFVPLLHMHGPEVTDTNAKAYPIKTKSH